jgi:hypothetical protein
LDSSREGGRELRDVEQKPSIDSDLQLFAITSKDSTGVIDFKWQRCTSSGRKEKK